MGGGGRAPGLTTVASPDGGAVVPAAHARVLDHVPKLG
jgi:hypothetical protein